MSIVVPLMQWDRAASHHCIEISEDGFTASSAAPSYFCSALGSYAMQPGRIYFFEVLLQTLDKVPIEAKVGVSQSQPLNNEVGFSGNALGWAFYSANGGQKRHNSNSGVFPYGKELRSTTQIGVLVDMADCRLGFVIEGVWHGFAFEAPEFVCLKPLYAGFSLLNSTTSCSLCKRESAWDAKKLCAYALRFISVFRRIPTHLMKEIAEFLLSFDLQIPPELMAALLARSNHV